MSMTDPIADFLTRIRNGMMAAHETVEIPSSSSSRRWPASSRSRATSRASRRAAGEPGDAGDRIIVTLKYTEKP